MKDMIQLTTKSSSSRDALVTQTLPLLGPIKPQSAIHRYTLERRPSIVKQKIWRDQLNNDFLLKIRDVFG